MSQYALGGYYWDHPLVCSYGRLCYRELWMQVSTGLEAHYLRK